MNEARQVMPIRFATIAVAAVLSATAWGDGGIFVRPSDNGRTWQVNVDPAEPIVWSWPEAATSARLVVTSYVERTAAVYDINRTEGADRYEWTLPPPRVNSVEGEYLYDLSLTVFNGQTVLQREFARVAYLPASFSLVPSGTAEWRDIRNERIIPYDADWKDAEAAGDVAVSFAAEGGSPEVFALAGLSGWEPLSLSRRFSPVPEFFSSTLLFDGEDAYEAHLRRVPKGFVLMLH